MNHYKECSKWLVEGLVGDGQRESLFKVAIVRGRGLWQLAILLLGVASSATFSRGRSKSYGSDNDLSKELHVCVVVGFGVLDCFIFIL
jgi:hypothetical protein